MQNGVTKDAQAVNFIANPYGQTLSSQGSGTRVVGETDNGIVASYISHSASGEILAALTANSPLNTRIDLTGSGATNEPSHDQVLLRIAA